MSITETLGQQGTATAMGSVEQVWDLDDDQVAAAYATHDRQDTRGQWLEAAAALSDLYDGPHADLAGAVARLVTFTVGQMADGNLLVTVVAAAVGAVLLRDQLTEAQYEVLTGPLRAAGITGL